MLHDAIVVLIVCLLIFKLLPSARHRLEGHVSLSSPTVSSRFSYWVCAAVVWYLQYWWYL